jgi:hypothetical protein
MRHIELHIIETDSDVALALFAGVLSTDQLDFTECDVCGEPIGHSTETDSFEQFVVVLEDEIEYLICTDCASPIIETEESEDDEDELDRF